MQPTLRLRLSVSGLPSLQALHEDFHKRGLVIAGINVRDKKSAPAVSQWLTERKLAFINVKAHDDGPNFPSEFRIPQTFLIDRNGLLVANKPGAWDWASSEVKIRMGHLLDGSRHGDR